MTWPRNGRPGGWTSRRCRPGGADPGRRDRPGPGRLYRLTGGNSFYVTEVVQQGLGVVPSSARDAVLARAARLGGGSRAVLEVAALIGARVELDLLTSVTASPPHLLDELLASGFSLKMAVAEVRHEIARLAVQQAVALHRRADIHARILAALGLLGCGDDARLAFHAEAAGDGGRCCIMRRGPRGRPLSWAAPGGGRRRARPAVCRRR